MKKYYSVLMMLVMMVAALSFTACGGDDEDDNTDNSAAMSLVHGWLMLKRSWELRLKVLLPLIIFNSRQMAA